VKLVVRLGAVAVLLAGFVAALVAVSPTSQASTDCPHFINYGTKNPVRGNEVDRSMSFSLRSCDGGATLYLWVRNNYPSGKTAVSVSYEYQNVQKQWVSFLDDPSVTLPAGHARYYPDWGGPTQYTKSMWPGGTIAALVVYYPTKAFTAIFQR
jgi:hypothetical protein